MTPNWLLQRLPPATILKHDREDSTIESYRNAGAAVSL